MTFQTDMYAVAYDILSELGQTITFTRDVVSDMNPMTGDVIDTTDTSYTGVGYPSNYNTYQIDGSVIQRDDVLLILNTPDAPLENDIFVINGKSYTALTIQNITAQGGNILYKVQLRQ